MKRNKKLSIVLAFALVLSLLGGMVVREKSLKAAPPAPHTLDYSADDNCFKIYSWQDLLDMNDYIDDSYFDGYFSQQGANNMTCNSATYVLMADISAPANNKWEPIGYEGGAAAPRLFSGEFNGNGHTISGLRIAMDKDEFENIGFFKAVEGAIIQNVTFDNCSIDWERSQDDETVEATNLGIVAGEVTVKETDTGTVGSTIENVIVKNSSIVPSYLPEGSTVQNASMIAGTISEYSEIRDVTLVNNTKTFREIWVPDPTDAHIGTADSTNGINDQSDSGGGSGGGGGGGTGPTNPTPTPSPSPTPTPEPTEEPDPVTPPAKGDAFVVDKVKYEVTGEKTIIVKKPDTNSSTVKIPQYIVKNGVTFKVVGIDQKAFYKNKKLKTIYLPDTIKSIGNSAFAYCDLLKYVYIQKTGKQQVTEQSMDALVPVSAAINISIGANAFLKCVALKKVVINCQVTSIGNSAFSLCKKLSSIVVYSKKLRTVGKKALNGVHNCKISVPKVKVKPYKSLFKNKGQGKKVVVAKM